MLGFVDTGEGVEHRQRVVLANLNHLARDVLAEHPGFERGLGRVELEAVQHRCLQRADRHGTHEAEILERVERLEVDEFDGTAHQEQRSVGLDVRGLVGLLHEAPADTDDATLEDALFQLADEHLTSEGRMLERDAGYYCDSSFDFFVMGHGFSPKISQSM